jgi:hypothetical protein
MRSDLPENLVRPAASVDLSQQPCTGIIGLQRHGLSLIGLKTNSDGPGVIIGTLV